MFIFYFAKMFIHVTYFVVQFVYDVLYV